jgi:hypothetical protein
MIKRPYKRGREVDSLERENLVAFYDLRVSKIWSDNRVAFDWSDPIIVCPLLTACL